MGVRGLAGGQLQGNHLHLSLKHMSEHPLDVHLLGVVPWQACLTCGALRCAGSKEEAVMMPVVDAAADLTNTGEPPTGLSCQPL